MMRTRPDIDPEYTSTPKPGVRPHLADGSSYPCAGEDLSEGHGRLESASSPERMDGMRRGSMRPGGRGCLSHSSNAWSISRVDPGPASVDRADRERPPTTSARPPTTLRKRRRAPGLDVPFDPRLTATLACSATRSISPASARAKRSASMWVMTQL